MPTSSEITVHEKVGDVLADPDTVQAALTLLAAMEKLRVVIVVDGVSHEGVIRFSGENAVVEVNITV